MNTPATRLRFREKVHGLRTAQGDDKPEKVGTGAPAFGVREFAPALRACQSAGKPDALQTLRAFPWPSMVLAIAACALAISGSLLAADNELTETEREQGWLLLFDGKTTTGWMTSDGKPSKAPVEQGSLNPHHSGHYMLVHTQQWSNFLLTLDFKISPGCNSGIFIRTASLTPRPGKDVGHNGIEIAIDDTPGAGYHDTGAIYDLVQPTRNAMRPVGAWNHIEIASITNRIEVVLNAEPVTRADLNLFVEPNRRPDGTAHKFDIAYKNHPQRGYLGLQDHGSPCWFKNIKLKPIPDP